MTSNGARGAAFERQCRAVLERAGYVVIRSAASKTGVDLVALPGPSAGYRVGVYEYASPRWPHTLVIQAKTDGRGHFGPADWDRLYVLARHAGAVPVLACREKVSGRLTPVLYRLDGPAVPRSTTPPWTRLELLEVPDGQA